MHATIPPGEIVEDAAVRGFSRLQVSLIVKLETQEDVQAAKLFVSAYRGGMKWPEIVTLRSGAAALVVSSDRPVKPIESSQG